MDTKDMNCEECKEQVFELIERESVDPEGVRAILERCPECRAEFEAMKAALAAAAQLAVEQPPAEIDSAILRAAAQRAEPNVISFRRRLLQAPPWAMAAVALLAVGVGVWSIPRTVEFESEVGSAGRETKDVAALEDAIAGEQFPDRVAREDFDQARGLQAKAVVEPAAPGPAAPSDEAAPAESDNRVPPRKASRARKRAATPRAAPIAADSAELEEASSAAAAPSMKAAESQAASRRLARDEVDAQADAYAGAKPESVAGGVTAAEVAAVSDDADAKRKARAACVSKVASFEKRLRDERRYEPTPEEQLAMGRCYQTLGDTKKARSWLERAATHTATKKRANESLERLGPK